MQLGAINVWNSFLSGKNTIRNYIRLIKVKESNKRNIYVITYWIKRALDFLRIKMYIINYSLIKRTLEIANLYVSYLNIYTAVIKERLET